MKTSGSGYYANEEIARMCNINRNRMLDALYRSRKDTRRSKQLIFDTVFLFSLCAFFSSPVCQPAKKLVYVHVAPPGAVLFAASSSTGAGGGRSFCLPRCVADDNNDVGRPSKALPASAARNDDKMLSLSSKYSNTKTMEECFVVVFVVAVAPVLGPPPHTLCWHGTCHGTCHGDRLAD